MELKLRWIEVAEGSIVLIPDDPLLYRIKRSIERARTESDTSVVDQTATDLRNKVADLVERFPDRLRERTFELRAITSGEEMQCSLEARHWDRDTWITDPITRDRKMLSIASGLTLSELNEMAPPLFNRLLDEVRRMTYPTVDELDFLLWQPTSSPSEAA